MTRDQEVSDCFIDGGPRPSAPTDSADPGWQAGVEWTLLWTENTAAQLTQGIDADARQGESPE
jgi:hypothetical protein